MGLSGVRDCSGYSYEPSLCGISLKNQAKDLLDKPEKLRNEPNRNENKDNHKDCDHNRMLDNKP